MLVKAIISMLALGATYRNHTTSEGRCRSNVTRYHYMTRRMVFVVVCL